MTGSTINILSPPIDITLSGEPLPKCTANLMPFSIDYDGPAPIDSFLVQRSASSDDPSSSSLEYSFYLSVQGRAIQSTPLQLPDGFVAKVVSVSQVASSSSISNTANDEVEATRRAEVERESKRRRIATQHPAKQQKFSMDSDDDEDGDEGEQEESEDETHSTRHPSPLPKPSDPESKAQISGPSISITPIAQVSPNHLTIWGPDGPIDKGDDSFFRTVGEWYAVVSPLLHA